MSTAYLPDAPTSTRLDITQDHEAFLGAPIGEMQGAYPNAYPLPGSFPPWDATIPSNVYTDDDFNHYFPNCQDSSTMYPPAGFIPAMANPAPPMNHTYPQAASSYDLPVGNATNTAAVLPSEVIAHQEVPFPFTFKHPLPTQPEAPPVQGQQHVQDAQGDLPVGNATNTAAVLSSEAIGHHEVPFPFMFGHPLPTQLEAPLVQGQQQAQDAQGDLPVGNATNTAAVLPSKVIVHHEVPFPFTFEQPLPTQPEAPLIQGQQQVQDAQGGFSAMEPLQEPGEVHNEDDQTYEESRATLVEPETYLNNIPSNPPAPNTAVHFCSDNPKSTCSENGTIDFNLLLAFIAKYPDGLSMVEKAIEHFDPATALGSNDGLSTGQLSQADTNDPLSLPHGVARCEMASSDSSTAASTSTQAHSAPSGSCPISPKQFEAPCEPSGSTRTDGSSTGKRRRSEEDGEPCNTTEGGEKRRKKKKLIQVDGEYICLICKIFQLRCFPLSRRDSLKRHIARLHKLFEILFQSEFDGFNILERRQIDQDENLFPFILLCISIQMGARARGVEIKAEQDLMLKYPDVVPKALMFSQS